MGATKVSILPGNRWKFVIENLRVRMDVDYRSNTNKSTASSKSLVSNPLSSIATTPPTSNQSSAHRPYCSCHAWPSLAVRRVCGRVVRMGRGNFRVERDSCCSCNGRLRTVVGGRCCKRCLLQDGVQRGTLRILSSLLGRSQTFLLAPKHSSLLSERCRPFPS